MASRRGDHHAAERLSHEEIEAWRALGSRRGEATALRHLAVALRYLGRLDEAEQLCERALALWQELDDAASVAHVRLTLGDLARLRGEHLRGVPLLKEAVRLRTELGDRAGRAECFEALELGLAATGRRNEAAGLLAAAGAPAADRRRRRLRPLPGAVAPEP